MIVFSGLNGGERGIRTLETVTRLHTFQACAFDHSATSPHICPDTSQGVEEKRTPLLWSVSAKPKQGRLRPLGHLSAYLPWHQPRGRREAHASLVECFGKAGEGMSRPGHSSQPHEQGIAPRSGWRTIQISCAGSSADIGIGPMVQRKVAPLRKLMAAIRFGKGFDRGNRTCKRCGSVGPVGGGNHT